MAEYGAPSCLRGGRDKMIVIADLSFVDESTDTREKFHFCWQIFEYLLCGEHWRCKNEPNGEVTVMAALHYR